MLVGDNAVPLAVPRRGEPDLVRSRELSATTVLITAFGEVDAASAGTLLKNIERYLRGYHQMVLDLSRLEFFGSAGFSALQRVHARCARAAVEWILVPGPEVQRLLLVCDPEGVLPTAPNIVSAVATLNRNHTRRVG